ncbi:MAG: 50S ribosomal protein L32 [Gammaproteobacteria bacterium]|nr:50S ribosomal protein L32 [Gammaproteobacteria bacterium]
MAVQQNKKSPSKKGMHRAHQALVSPAIAIQEISQGRQEVYLRHHISPSGVYRGKQVIQKDQKDEISEE